MIPGQKFADQHTLETVAKKKASRSIYIIHEKLQVGASRAQSSPS